MDKIKSIAYFLYQFRQEHNLSGSEKEDYKMADRILTDLELEDELSREYGKVTF